MNIQTVKTDKITVGSQTLFGLLNLAIAVMEEKSILVVTSKIVSICEGRVVKIGDKEKINLIKEDAQYYIPPEQSPLAITLTVTRNLLVPTAGIDESNGNGYYILWPKDTHQSARDIRQYLISRFHLQDVGVLITDSRTTPMRWGTTGIALSYCGFSGLNDYIGTPDLFGRTMEVTKANIADGLAAAAVVCMGESREQTPLAVMTDMPFVQFNAKQPTEKELAEWQIPMETDLYGPLLKSNLWKKGHQS